MSKDMHELEVLVRSRVPVVAIESHDENRALSLLRGLQSRLGRPLFSWSVTEGLQRVDANLGKQKIFAEPEAALKHIKAVTTPGTFVLRDMHPYLSDPLIVRLLKDIALAYDAVPHTLVLVSHELKLPAELSRLAAHLVLAMPERPQIEAVVDRVVADWQRRREVFVDEKARSLLVDNLTGLSLRDAERLATNAICDDEALTRTDIPRVMQAKYELLAERGVLHFEFDTARF